jgi:multiple antibiotic resistance protein
MILSLVNPVICGAMFAQATSGKNMGEKVADATRVTLVVSVILCLAAVGGAQALKAFGISIEAFQVAGGMVLTWMGFMMLCGAKSPTTGEKQKEAGNPLTPLILFAASPGTITGVITLSVSNAKTRLPITALVAVIAALGVTWLVMVLVARSAGKKKQGLFHDITTRFMGLIVLAMGVQFTLTGFTVFIAA